MTHMRTIYCANIINGERCNKPRQVKKMAWRATYCKECADERQRIMSSSYYKRNHAEIRKKRNAEYRKTGMSEAQKSKNKRNKSLVRSTKCKCPRCGSPHKKSLFLCESERARVDSGKPYRKMCHKCELLAGRTGPCPDADGYSVGVM